jgi:DNA-binding response OmpR family regulator
VARTISPMRILVVEDEDSIADFVRRGLESEGYSVTWTSDGLEGEALALGGGFDLVLLDLMLPGRSGIDVLSSVRKAFPALPVILLTARGDVDDRVRGLDAGATDYVPKPFSFEELAARVRAHLRTSEQEAVTRLEAGDLVINLLPRHVERAGRPISLSATEFDLLALLARHVGEVVSREQILAAVWGYDFDPGTNVVGVYVSYLRKKLALPGHPAPIETVRSVGYRLRGDG